VKTRASSPSAVRLEPKSFRQRRPDGRGGHLWSLGDVRRVPYRLRDLQGQARILIVEGEKDADNLWALGLAATTNAGGAGKWTAALTADLVRAGIENLVILPDNDAPGRKHARDIARQFIASGVEVKIVELPGLLAKHLTTATSMYREMGMTYWLEKAEAER
jgi:5S rRNA maturation endonuclease (ribonuclease M5)